MSSSTTLVLALSLCLLLLGFSHSSEAAARPITAAATNRQCENKTDLLCFDDFDCNKKCVSQGFGGGDCLNGLGSQKIDVNRFAVTPVARCCCLPRL
ncbi:hypothetical protein MKW94_015528 [Papaver nudicaule]|uniref:Uncharacterized protein n=1 Tax=Papaver nudicaule TaxID=74823 RepID=A0AA41VFS8_PAPNU|nr:hypothetical protein [Papaver nudicaule]